MKFVILLALHDADILHGVDAVARPAAEPGIIRVLPAALCVFRAAKRLVQPVEHRCGLFARDERIRAERSVLVTGNDTKRRRDLQPFSFSQSEKTVSGMFSGTELILLYRLTASSQKSTRVMSSLDNENQTLTHAPVRRLLPPLPMRCTGRRPQEVRFHHPTHRDNILSCFLSR